MKKYWKKLNQCNFWKNNFLHKKSWSKKCSTLMSQLNDLNQTWKCIIFRLPNSWVVWTSRFSQQQQAPNNKCGNLASRENRKKFPTFKITHGKFNFPDFSCVHLLAFILYMVARRRSSQWITWMREAHQNIFQHNILLFEPLHVSLAAVDNTILIVFLTLPLVCSFVGPLPSNWYPKRNLFWALWFFWIFIRMNWKEGTRSPQNWCIKFNAW